MGKVNRNKKVCKRRKKVNEKNSQNMNKCKYETYKRELKKEEITGFAEEERNLRFTRLQT